MRKGYTPKTSREKFPLTVEEQRRIALEAQGREKSLLLLMLSTGMHPSVLAQRKHRLAWDKTYYSWNRPKTGKKVTGAWSRAMREGDNIGHLSKLRNKTTQRLWQIIDELGERVGIKGLCPLQLRHTYFVNRARLGHNVYDISHGAATGMDVIYDYYTIGMGESKQLSKEDREFLQWLMEV